MITIGTRGSKLALVQAHWVAEELNRRGIENTVRIIKTKGDVVQDRFDKIEGKGFFTKEIEDELHHGDIDLAVHCLKDLPTAGVAGLRIAAVTQRENPYDLLISKQPFHWRPDGYPDLDGKVIGTSSTRRVAGLSHIFPNASFVPLRGNVPTRLDKLRQGDAEVIVLAAAGINRLSLALDDVFAYQAVPPLLVPAPGQGALALQVREDDPIDLGFLHHEITADCTAGERHILAVLEGGCHLPLGVMIRQRAAEDYHLELFLGGETRAAHIHLSLSGTSPQALTEEALAHLRELGRLAS